MNPSFFFSRHRCALRAGLALVASLAMARSSLANGRYLVRQTTNADCGPAALATLLRYYLDVPTTENEIARLASVNQFGTTLAGLEYATEAKGAGADSFRMTPATLEKQLQSYPTPVLVRLLLPEPHFLLVLGMENDLVTLADPGSGNIMMPQTAFFRRWLIPGTKEGYVLVAARADGRVDTKRRAEVMTELRREKQLLMDQRPAPLMRR
jgi:predicted double-glycine peptidase